MMHKNQAQSADTIALVNKIVMAYVSNNHIPAVELPGLMSTVHSALNNIASGTVTDGANAPDDEVALPTPAEIRKSIRPDGLVSFIDGKPYKTLKRHLNGHGLGPHSYRKRFGLPADYPMTAASYSEKRSALARELGLGRPRRMAA
ncbi:MucR family transcriptional regulator [Methylobacterium sp. J-059]|uniref:MucR family transcriptional regulator n=1 Tax=Methylobacterium sp. J-059 TaxID=2836643 RepID=UPI001FB984C8|nr:MucR family transcriptional regulator [Methylobacterium sp. J-059]MCJ2038259.1 MucR family transcriptional regulator [Methylobacterium sp. J-059]